MLQISKKKITLQHYKICIKNLQQVKCCMLQNAAIFTQVIMIHKKYQQVHDMRQMATQKLMLSDFKWLWFWVWRKRKANWIGEGEWTRVELKFVIMINYMLWTGEVKIMECENCDCLTVV